MVATSPSTLALLVPLAALSCALDPAPPAAEELDELAAGGARLPLEGPFSAELAIGGGPGFAGACDDCRFYRPADALMVVRSRADLDEALRLVEGSRNKLVYIADDAEIDLAGRVWRLPAGTILASGRGRDGSRGGLLLFSAPEGPAPLEAAAGDVRISGLRLRGPDPAGDLWWVDDRDTAYQNNVVGVRLLGRGSIVENSQLYGWTVAAISVEGGAALVRYNHIHHNSMGTLGYGVQARGGAYPLVEYNYFNANRHSIATSGVSGYTARYNFFGSQSLLHVLDSHESDDEQPAQAGRQLVIHHNTFAPARNPYTGGRPPAVKIRGITVEPSKIHHNWFRGFDEPPGPHGGAGAAVVQIKNGSEQFENVEMWSNGFGLAVPRSSEVGLRR